MSDKLLLDWMPVRGSTWAGQVDFINNFITYVSAFCTIGITAAMLYYAWRYRRRPGNEQCTYITHNATVETVWTVVPTIVCVFILWYGFVVYKDMRNPPANSIEIYVEGRKWAWTYKYANGKTADADLVVPVGKPIRLILRSKDVNHSFFLPAMRVKEDVIANEYHYLWFTPTVIGESHIFCTEYCGMSHSGMVGKLKVVTEEEFQDFLNDRKPEDLSPEDLGRKLYTAKGCNACHSLDGTKVLGPSFKGVYGKEEMCEGGIKVTVDDNYIRESVLHPQKLIVQGYQPVMPPFEGQLKEEEIQALIAFIKAQK